ncbi:uncharacterized protein LOC108021887 [Drosophila biarmipes]|uniref:uncharacterized protein LOC108021887 n=1 Tax=Drosophila biarmipes TaxID=125945 RepID=UPI0007E62DCD|nr:uncharacterized protein LOC108021887 [Drosophila biarmipes]
MRNVLQDKYPEKFDFDEEVNRVKLEFDMMFFAEMEEAIFGESEPEDANEVEASPSEGSGEDSDRHI